MNISNNVLSAQYHFQAQCHLQAQAARDVFHFCFTGWYIYKCGFVAPKFAAVPQHGVPIVVCPRPLLTCACASCYP